MTRASLLVFILAGLSPLSRAIGLNQIPVSAPLLTDSPGKASRVIKTSVFRIQCPSIGVGGSAFLHRSGKLITAAHVVSSCLPKDIEVISPSGERVDVTIVAKDEIRDLALLAPRKGLMGEPIPISTASAYWIGAQVSAWGYPYGYNGVDPLLSVGYIAGLDYAPVNESISVQRLIVNGAFNSGNSGGPVLDVESGTVVGVVAAKVAPIPPEIEADLKYLQSVHSGIGAGSIIGPDGKERIVVEGQVVGSVLDFLRRQTQLVVGQAVMLGDVRDFLAANGVSP